jgi:hypothetical protein
VALPEARLLAWPLDWEQAAEIVCPSETWAVISYPAASAERQLLSRHQVGDSELQERCLKWTTVVEARLAEVEALEWSGSQLTVLLSLRLL